eukprot:g15005.t1 g15005   contig21:338851-340566(+)
MVNAVLFLSIVQTIGINHPPMMMADATNASPHRPPLYNDRLIKRSANDTTSNGSTGDGLTVGDLEVMQNENDESGGLFASGAHYPAPSSSSSHQSRHHHHHHDDPERRTQNGNEEYTTQQQQQIPNQLKRSLRKINLDLSGRIMCHVVSPRRIGTADSNAAGRESRPLFHILSEEKKEGHSMQHQRSETHSLLQNILQKGGRFIPHLYLGANYDLDEIWYGVTRWIAKCSWGPSVSDDGVHNFATKEKSSSTIAIRGRKFANRVFPSSPFAPLSPCASWMLDVEGEQSVFDAKDNTVRVSLIQADTKQNPNDMTYDRRTQFTPSPQKLSVEYNSAKYGIDAYSRERSLQCVPTLRLNLETPILHPRLELHSKRTWVVREGGDRDGNYYGGTHYGSYSPVERRLSQIKERFRESVPQSTPFHSSDTTLLSTGRIKDLYRRVSTWVENDGWMPRKVTTDLMGNLVSVNEISLRDGKSRSGPSHRYIPSMNNMGVRLRISKKIDWTTLGVFPWSNNSRNGQKNELLRGAKSMHLQLELCGMNETAEKRAWIGMDVYPLNFASTLKVVIGREDVN